MSTHGYSQNQILVWKYPSLTQVAKLTGHSYRVLYLVSVGTAALGPCGCTWWASLDGQGGGDTPASCCPLLISGAKPPLTSVPVLGCGEGRNPPQLTSGHMASVQHKGQCPWPLPVRPSCVLPSSGVQGLCPLAPAWHLPGSQNLPAAAGEQPGPSVPSVGHVP